MDCNPVSPSCRLLPVFSPLPLDRLRQADPFFLYTLDVGEDDFHELKRDQSLLVDFEAFPRKVIELLDSCIHEGAAGPGGAGPGPAGLDGTHAHGAHGVHGVHGVHHASADVQTGVSHGTHGPAHPRLTPTRDSLNGSLNGHKGAV